MNANTEVDYELLEAAIVADIRAEFPDLQTVEFYREDRKGLPKPAVLLEMTEWEADEDNDPGTEQLAILAHFEAEIIISFRAVDGRKAKAEVRRLANALGAWMHNRRWNRPGFTGEPGTTGSVLPTGPVQVVGAYPDDFQNMEPGKKGDALDKYEVWRLTWQQKIHLGKSVWNWIGTTPQAIFGRGAPQGFPLPDEFEQYAEGLQGE